MKHMRGNVEWWLFEVTDIIWLFSFHLKGDVVIQPTDLTYYLSCITPISLCWHHSLRVTSLNNLFILFISVTSFLPITIMCFVLFLSVLFCTLYNYSGDNDGLIPGFSVPCQLGSMALCLHLNLWDESTWPFASSCCWTGAIKLFLE